MHKTPLDIYERLVASADRREQAKDRVPEGDVRKHIAIQLEEFHRQESDAPVGDYNRPRHLRSARRPGAPGRCSATAFHPLVDENVCMIASSPTKQCHSEKSLSEFYPQDGGESQLALKLRHCHPIYTVSQKSRHQTLGHNFTNYYPIFKIFSLAHSVVNLQQTHV